MKTIIIFLDLLALPFGPRKLKTTAQRVHRNRTKEASGKGRWSDKTKPKKKRGRDGCTAQPYTAGA
jgi:hypothetical protein